MLTQEALVSRQFVEMPRSRIEGLLASFPKLIGTGDQHTFVETESVRYVYQPLEDLFMVLVTNKHSNILQDIETLHMFARSLSEYCRSIDEREITYRAFELISVFDEIVSLGMRENVTLSQIRTITEMESHEEKVAAEIQKNKEKEAKEELNRKARMMELQKRQMGGRGSYGGSGSYGGGGYGGGSRGSYEPVVSSQTSFEQERPSFSSKPAAPSAPAPGRGMQLGKKPKAADLMDALRSDNDLDALLSPARGPAGPSSAPVVHTESVHITIDERIVAVVKRDGGIDNFEVKGDMSLKVSDPDKAKVRVELNGVNDDGNIQFKTHPNVDKNLFGSEHVLGLKDSSKPLPLNQALGILRWRYTSKDESALPLTINCWPSASGDGSVDVNIEYEMERSDLELKDVVISIPFPSGRGVPTVGDVDGMYEIDKQHRSIEWQIPIIDASNKSGSMEFSMEGEDTGAFFPIRVHFMSSRSYFNLEVGDVVSVDDGSSIVFSQDVSMMPDEYSIV